MTNLEKQHITRMRESGKTYAVIAENLHLPVNTVKSGNTDEHYKE